MKNVLFRALWSSSTTVAFNKHAPTVRHILQRALSTHSPSSQRNAGSSTTQLSCVSSRASAFKAADKINNYTTGKPPWVTIQLALSLTMEGGTSSCGLQPLCCSKKRSDIFLSLELLCSGILFGLFNNLSTVFNAKTLHEAGYQLAAGLSLFFLVFPG